MDLGYGQRRGCAQRNLPTVGVGAETRTNLIAGKPAEALCLEVLEAS